MSVAERLSALTPEQRALFEALRRKQRESQAAKPLLPPPVRRVTGPTAAGDWPLSIDQERLWRMHRENPALVSWNVDAASRMRGEIAVPALAAALRELIRRHAAWRATFPVIDGRPVQRIVESAELDFALIDVSALPAERREAAGRRALFDRTRAVFDLERGPLVRAALVRTAAGEHLCLLTVHHIATDWITFQIAFQELMALYDAARAGDLEPAAGARAAVPGLRRLGARAVERRDAAGVRRVLARRARRLPARVRPARRPPPPAGAEPARRHDPVHLRPRAGPSGCAPSPAARG